MINIVSGYRNGSESERYLSLDAGVVRAAYVPGLAVSPETFYTPLKIRSDIVEAVHGCIQRVAVVL